MAFKMKKFSGFGNSMAKQTEENYKTYPESYKKEDIEFLKRQREDVVRREDLDEEGKKLYDKNQKKAKIKKLEKRYGKPNYKK